MSRCFPFPPPGYGMKRARDETLIESIKRETANAQKDGKENKKRRKRRKEKAQEEGKSSDKKHSHKRKHRGGNLEENYAGRDHHKKQRTDSKPTERSSLTEEHGLPVTSQNSTESTLSSSNDQQIPLSLVPEGRQISASTIRIQLHQQRKKEPQVNLPGEQPSSSAPGRTMSISLVTSQGKNMSNTLLSTSQTTNVDIPRSNGDRMAPKKPSLISSLQGQIFSAPEGTLINLSMAACTVPQNNGDRETPGKVCLTSSFTSTGSFAHLNKNVVGSSNGSRVFRTIPCCPSTGIEEPCLVSTFKGRESPAPGQTISGDASLGASQMYSFVPRTTRAMAEGPKQSSHHGKATGTSSVNAPLMSGIVLPTGGDRRRSVPQTSGNCVWKEHLQSTPIPGETTAKPPICGDVARSSEEKSNPQHISSASSPNPNIHGRLYLGKEKDSCPSGVETQAHRAESSSTPCSSRDRSSSEKYAKLVEDWLLPSFPISLDLEDDQQWLLGRKHHKGNEERKVENCGQQFTGSNSSLWPLACFLPEAESYVLPYTVPY
ncbi:hypothetical protein SAY87_024931 [Trapa incisa]|uniref:Uncharacterized protein n=1 Tax=Trapa incisa TaxID=236973 RepID=A0AAN7GCU6_9MYRT|nr:hypothetical protein SAY87_024931 [Trapa incisa]